MKIILKDFNYDGCHFEEFEFDMPNLKDLEEIPVDKLLECIFDDLNDFIDFNRGFNRPSSLKKKIRLSHYDSTFSFSFRILFNVS